MSKPVWTGVGEPWRLRDEGIILTLGWSDNLPALNDAYDFLSSMPFKNGGCVFEPV